MGVVVVGGVYENSKPLRGLEFFATRSMCTCRRVEGTPSALRLSFRFLLAHPHHMTKTATTNSNVQTALQASQLLTL